MEGLEGQLGRISMTALRYQEKAYLAHQAAVDAVHKSSYSGGGAASSRGRGKQLVRVKARGRGKVLSTRPRMEGW